MILSFKQRVCVYMCVSDMFTESEWHNMTNSNCMKRSVLKWVSMSWERFSETRSSF